MSFFPQRAASKAYVDSFKDPSVKKNQQVLTSTKNPRTVRYIKVNILPALRETLTPMLYLDNALDVSTRVRMKDQDFNYNSLINISHLTLIFDPTDDIHAAIKTYVKSLSQNHGSRPNLSVVFNDLHSEFDHNNLTHSDIFTVKGDATLDNELKNKNGIDDSIGSGQPVRFNQTLEKNSKVSVENSFYQLTGYEGKKLQIQTIYCSETQEAIWCKDGIWNEMTELMLEKKQFLKVNKNEFANSRIKINILTSYWW